VCCDHAVCVMWPCCLCAVTMLSVSCDHAVCVLWPCCLCPVTMLSVCCDHAVCVLWPCCLCHVTMLSVCCDHAVCVMWPCCLCAVTMLSVYSMTWPTSPRAVLCWTATPTCPRPTACSHSRWDSPWHFLSQFIFVFDLYEWKVFVFKYFPKVFDFFKYFFKYIVSINISASRSHIITFTATSPNSANYWWRHLTAGVPMALAVTTTFVCSEPEDGLAPDSDHRSLSPLFISQTPSWHHAILVSWLTLKLRCYIPHKILAVISSVSSEGSICILLWISWLNLSNKQIMAFTSVDRGFWVSCHCDVVSNNNTP